MDFLNPPAEPIPQFQAWFADAAERCEMLNPNAFTLATVRPDGTPAARIVLLKHMDERGAVFYTNYDSAKAQQLEATPRAAMLFYWDALIRQVRIEGTVARVSDAESDAYFATRPRDSRIGAWASIQSQPLESREALAQRVAEFDAKYPGEDVPRPPHWGGYRITPDRIEFWEGQVFRLHDRLVYTRPAPDEPWQTQLLYP